MPGTQQVAWGNLRVAHLDSGIMEHPAFRDFAIGAAWLRPAEGINRREPGVPTPPSGIGVALCLPAIPCRVVDSVCYPAKYRRTIGVGGVTPSWRI